MGIFSLNQLCQCCHWLVVFFVLFFFFLKPLFLFSIFSLNAFSNDCQTLFFLIFAAQWHLAIQPRSPLGPLLVNIHCDCQRHFFHWKEKDRGAVFVADHPLSLQTQDREPPLPHHVERDRGKNVVSQLSQCGQNSPHATRDGGYVTT